MSFCKLAESIKKGCNPTTVLGAIIRFRSEHGPHLGVCEFAVLDLELIKDLLDGYQAVLVKEQVQEV